MNAMSVSPVKPTLNPGNHAVPATATNLAKSPLPSSNFAPINLIPETKPISAVNAVPANTENSVDLSSKPPTSNGIVSPIPENNSKENSGDVPQNHNEKSNAVENLTTADAPQKPVEVVSEAKNLEKSKPEEPKNSVTLKENSGKYFFFLITRPRRLLKNIFVIRSCKRKYIYYVGRIRERTCKRCETVAGREEN